MVIFVHELGHFAVAKMCGVKCEKFYLGFDIYGLKLLHFKWGETEYGIGILPLGGYVKMLGQDDNPAHAAEELRRSQLPPDAAAGANPPLDTPAAAAATAAQPLALDPRSYMAKSVPQRMAIISAGVIMNVIFGFLMAVAAYSLGVNEIACGTSVVQPGEPAWRVDIRPGDQFIKINNSGTRQLRFRDLLTAVALCNMEKGVDFRVKREGVADPFPVTVKPSQEANRMRPTIGVGPPCIAELSDPYVAWSDTPADGAGFLPNDKIVAIGDATIATYADIDAQLVRHPGEVLKVTVERTPPATNPEPAEVAAPPERVDVEVPARPMRTLGLVMKMGPIKAVQANSPAAKAGLQAGDFITAIDGQSPGDPLRLPEVLRRRAGETITVSFSRAGQPGQNQMLEERITLREPGWIEEAAQPGTPVSIPALGVAYKVLNIVHETDKGSPAADAELNKDGKPAGVPRFALGDQIVSAAFKLPPAPERADNDATSDEEKHTKRQDWSKLQPIPLSDEQPNWPFLMDLLQHMPPGTKVLLQLSDGRTTTLDAVNGDDWFYADRGLVFAFDVRMTKAHSFSEAVSLGGYEMVDGVLQVYAFLRRLGSQVSIFMLGGPKSIAEAAGYAAYGGVSQLLIFLTLLSANLAVVNFLPIPLLDGGHMVFLALEGIMGRPVSERVVVAFHYLGFVFIITLMLFLLGLDFGIIPRPH
jgi:regulator of sigma E protease